MSISTINIQLNIECLARHRYSAQHSMSSPTIKLQLNIECLAWSSIFSATFSVHLNNQHSAQHWMSSLSYRRYLHFWNEYDIYFIEWSEKIIFHEWRSHEWNIHFLASRDEINGIFIPKIWIFFLLYTILSVTDFCTKWRHTRSHITSF